jgi:tRNA1Val (adenine37-N6)-methyltransferase
MERWEWLIEPKTGIFQDPALGCFTEDPIALVHFARIGRSDTVLDLGTGNGVLCLYAEALYGGTYTGVDADERQIALARRSAERNGQTIRFLPMRVEDAPDAFGHGTFSRILMNPPYFVSGDEGKRAAARHAKEGLLSDWCRAAFLLLNNGGTLSLCYPADRLVPLLRALDENRLAPKRMQLLMQGTRARLALLEAKKLGGDGLIITAVPGAHSGRLPDEPPVRPEGLI